MRLDPGHGLLRPLRRLWWQLTRPRGQAQHRFYRTGRSSRAGVALLLVIANLLFLTVIITEITYGASVRIKLAAHQRDEAKAEALARTGADMYRLVLVSSKQFGKQLAQFGLPGELWQLLPFVNTGLMRMLFVSGGDLDDDEVEEFRAEGLSEEEVEESREGSGITDNFLDFDGDFFAEVEDEDRKINISQIKATNAVDLMADPFAQALFGLMSGKRQCSALAGITVVDGQVDMGDALDSNDDMDDHDQFFYDQNLDRWDLIANLADWVDLDGDRLRQGGQEEALYQALPSPYRPKNAAFDSMDEVRLVDGWHRDDVWERYGQHITVYGAGKINVNTADCEVLWGLLQAYVQPNTPEFLKILMSQIEMTRAMVPFSNEAAFISVLEAQGATVDPKLRGTIGTKSTVFRVKSTGEVGAAVVSINAVYDFSSSNIGKVVYWRVE